MCKDFVESVRVPAKQAFAQGLTKTRYKDTKKK
jgi:hypothetical protein